MSGEGTEDRRLAVLVGAARSGTTLTRLILDAHPEVGCPSEAGLPALMAQLARVWSTVNADRLGSGDIRDPGKRREDGEPLARWEAAPDREVDELKQDTGDQLTVAAREWIVKTVQRPMVDYCAPDGKPIYCDKSLDSVFHLDLVRSLFPDVRVVLLFRHVMDTIASGLEASPWGFNAYGYAPYVQASPGNTVAALASYWLDHVARALAWEDEHQEFCYRIRYEDLVLQPEKTVSAMQRFLGVAEDCSVLAAAFGRTARGPGDYKVEHTNEIHAHSIGHGKRVPVAMLPPALLGAVNEKLNRLGYESLDRGWNAAERSVDCGSTGLWAVKLREIMIELRPPRGDGTLGTCAIVAEDHQALRWVINLASGTVTQGDGDVEAVLTGRAEDLVLMLTDEENLGVLLRSGRLRHIVADEDEAARRDVMQELHRLVGALRRGRSSGVPAA
jgi:hypothetical protein